MVWKEVPNPPEGVPRTNEHTWRAATASVSTPSTTRTTVSTRRLLGGCPYFPSALRKPSMNLARQLPQRERESDGVKECDCLLLLTALTSCRSAPRNVEALLAVLMVAVEPAT